MALKVVPPKQDGNNCALVALCHAANYFGIKPTKSAYLRLEDVINQRKGAMISHVIQAAPGFLKGLEVTFYVPKGQLGYLNQRLFSGSIKGQELAPNFEYTALCEASLAAYAVSVEKYHIEFRVDNYHFTNIEWFALIHQPGVTR